MKVIVQPLSVRLSMDIWDPDGRYGKMCDRRAAAGRLDRGGGYLVVDLIKVPSGW